MLQLEIESNGRARLIPQQDWLRGSIPLLVELNLVVLFPICRSIVGGNHSKSLVQDLLHTILAETVARAYPAVVSEVLGRIVMMVLIAILGSHM